MVGYHPWLLVVALWLPLLGILPSCSDAPKPLVLGDDLPGPGAQLADTGWSPEAPTDADTEQDPSDASSATDSAACTSRAFDGAPSAGQCLSVGAPGIDCNPVTSLPCNVAAGDVCEFNGSAFACQHTRAPGALGCASCVAGSVASCGATFTCLGGTDSCASYCCNDSDCAPGIACVLQPPTAVGICGAAVGNAFRAFDTDAATLHQPACSISTSSSVASCVTLGAFAECNPIDGTGCSVYAGETCVRTSQGYRCQSGSQSQSLCQACTGPGDCQLGYQCMPSLGLCARYCCEDSDCAPGRCSSIGEPSISLGVCVRDSDGG